MRIWVSRMVFGFGQGEKIGIGGFGQGEKRVRSGLLIIFGCVESGSQRVWVECCEGVWAFLGRWLKQKTTLLGLISMNK